MNKHLLFSILLVALTQLSFAQQSSVEGQIEITLEYLLDLKDMPVLAGQGDPFAAPNGENPSQGIDFDKEWLINTVRSSSGYKYHRPVYESFLQYEELMLNLSRLLQRIDFEELVAAQEDPSAELLLRIAHDRINNWEHYREIYEFYSQPKWQCRGIQQTPEEQEIDLKLTGRGYKYAWIYYLYAPEIVETRIINQPNDYHGRIVRVLAEIDDGEAYPFVLRELGAYIDFVQKADSFVPYRSEIGSAINHYLIDYPNDTSLKYIMRASQGWKDYVNLGERFAHFLKSENRELQAAWEALFEEVEQDADAAFTEFLKGYYSNS